MTKIAKKAGRLLKGGEPDIDTVSKMVIFDWQRGKIPFFVAPPFDDDHPQQSESASDEVTLLFWPQ